jgi:hypothetical protein
MFISIRTEPTASKRLVLLTRLEKTPFFIRAINDKPTFFNKRQY